MNAKLGTMEWAGRRYFWHAIAILVVAGLALLWWQLEPSPQIDASAAVSPDGQEIVFSGAARDGNGLYLLHLSNHKVHRLKVPVSFATEPSFSHDGTQIVFKGSMLNDGSGSLFILDLRSLGVKRITDTPDTSDEYPTFSGDDRKIVFNRSDTIFDRWAGDVYSCNPDGSGAIRLTFGNYPGETYPDSYSADQPVAFSAFNVSPQFTSTCTVSTVENNGSGKVRCLIDTGGWNCFPVFYAGGKKIVFTSDLPGPSWYDIYTTKLPPKSRPVRLGVFPCCIQIHDLSVPKSGNIVYFIAGYSPELWAVNIDGSSLHRVADASIFLDPMHWHGAN